MFNSNSGYSLADIAAATGNNNCNNGGWNDGGAWWIIILFLFCFAGGWGNGRGGLFGGSDSTGSGITDGYILTSDFANIERKIDNVNNGICDGFYAMNTGMLNGFGQVNNNITQQTIADMQNTNAVTAQITALGTQMSQCCCDNKYQSATQAADLNYRLAEQSCQTRQAIADAAQAVTLGNDANTRSILAAIQDMNTQALQDKIATLTADNQALKFAASQQAQNAYLVHTLAPSPNPAYIVPNPYTGNYGYNNCGGCGCACVG
jgi:hypothetical protein